MEFFSGSASDRGSVRPKNQDRVVSFSGALGGHQSALVMVCDGIGSFENSEIASEMIADGIRRWIDGVEKNSAAFSDRSYIIEDLEETIRELNEAVCEYRNETGISIGCTMSLLIIIDNDYFIFHVGDSRVCQFDGAFSALTRDEVTLREKNNKVKALLANFIGKDMELWLNKYLGPVKGGDTFFAASDGVFKTLSNDDLSRFSSASGENEMQMICEDILRAVIERGATDNVSIAAVHVREKGKRIRGFFT